MNKKLSLENRIKNSKLQITNKFLYYALAPLTIIIVGIILLFTVGFNGGVDFKGGSSFTLYVNNGGEYAQAAKYDIEEDYDIICNKLEQALAEENLKIEYFQKTQIDIEAKTPGSVAIANGDAIKVVFKNTSTDIEKIAKENKALKSRILSTFGYYTNTEAITDIEYQEPIFTIGWALALVGAVVFAAAVALSYFALRTRSCSWLVGLLPVAIDLVVLGGLLLICRIPLSLNVAAVVACTVFASLINVFVFFKKAKRNIDDGLYENLSNGKMADSTTKQLAVKKGMIYVVLAIISIVLACMPSVAISGVGLGLFASLITTFYTSTFILPAVWAASYRESKKIKKS